MDSERNQKMTGAAWLERLSSGLATKEEEGHYKAAFQELCEAYKAKHGVFPTRVEFAHLSVLTLESARASDKAA